MAILNLQVRINSQTKQVKLEDVRIGETTSHRVTETLRSLLTNAIQSKEQVQETEVTNLVWDQQWTQGWV